MEKIVSTLKSSIETAALRVKTVLNSEPVLRLERWALLRAGETSTWVASGSTALILHEFLPDGAVKKVLLIGGLLGSALLVAYPQSDREKLHFDSADQKS
jgi:hypothetical protein